MLRKRVGHDFTHLNKPSWKLPLQSRSNTLIIIKFVVFVIFQWSILVQSKKAMT